MRALPIAVWLLALVISLPAQRPALEQSEQVAPGIQLYRLDDPALLTPPGPVAVQALRVDPAAAMLEIASAHGTPSRETVATIAARRPGTVAAINAGFFALDTGKPTALLKINGKILGTTTRARGAVAIRERRGRAELLFDRVTVTAPQRGRPQYRTLLGSSAADWARAPFAISGAGLLMRDGRELTDWADERIANGFDTARHPRTMIGTDANGAIWLVTVDGRNPLVSLGMSFTELQGLSRRLGLRSALNLDGGGSTTMWVDGKVANHPSDPGGPRKVGDAILVVPRRSRS